MKVKEIWIQVRYKMLIYNMMILILDSSIGYFLSFEMIKESS